MIDITKACDIEGWMTGEELEWLAKQADSHNNILELGPWMGRSTLALLANTSGRVTVIDDWKGPRDYEKWKSWWPDLRKEEIHQEYMNKFKENTKDYAGILTIRIGLADNVVKSLFAEGYKFDMVFIDADHTYDSVMQDVENCKLVLSDGGLLCGHDYAKPYDDYIEAIEELNGKVVKGTTIWYL